MVSKKTKPAKPTTIKIHPKDLPLSCPMPNQKVWNLHPKVYLPIDKTKDENCPYCGQHYVLVS